MTTNTGRESAKIYAFPVKPRTGAERGEGRRPGEVVAVPCGPTVEFGSGWYHETAIRDAERTDKPWR